MGAARRSPFVFAFSPSSTRRRTAPTRSGRESPCDRPRREPADDDGANCRNKGSLFQIAKEGVRPLAI
jgi:hypothetical protein